MCSKHWVVARRKQKISWKFCIGNGKHLNPATDDSRECSRYNNSGETVFSRLTGYRRFTRKTKNPLFVTKNAQHDTCMEAYSRRCHRFQDSFLATQLGYRRFAWLFSQEQFPKTVFSWNWPSCFQCETSWKEKRRKSVSWIDGRDLNK